MQLRTIALVLSTVGILYSGFASALGLGEITLKSQFNQPLNAEIKLLKVRDLSKDEIFAALASREDFKRVGVDRLFFLSSFEFEVDLKNPSNPIIKVTSPKPITEPYLNFLVEVQWPSGRLLREYTLLLDLPVFNEAAPSAPVSRPNSVAIASPIQVTPAPQASASRPVVSAPSSANSSANSASAPKPVAPIPAPKETAPEPTFNVQSSVEDYKVKSGDTLWDITEATLADSQASMNQKMIAILQANPNAFIKGNINRLKNGRVLRIPTNEEVANVSYQQAIDTVREQNQAWSAENKSAQKAVLTSAVPSVSASQDAAKVEGRLTLGSAGSGQSSVKGTGASGSGESLQNELAIASDELARSTRQNQELSSRISELESQIETMESLVSVTSDQLKALEVTSKIADENDSTSADTIADQNVATSQESTDSQESPVSSTEAVPAAVQEPAPFVVPEPATPNNFAPAAEPSLVQTIIEFLKTNMLIVGGALLGLLVALLVLMRLKKKPEDDLNDFELDEENEDLFDLDDNILGDDNDLDDASYEEDNAFSMDEDLDESVQAQTEDVVAEADIYVSFGQEDKAIELLQKEIQQNPDNADARLGLLKIFAKSQNSTGFDEQYAQLLPLGNVYANDQAMALRKEIENAEPFDTDQYSLKDDGLDFLDEIESDDLDLDIDLDSAAKSLDDGSIALSETDSDFDSDELSLDLDDVSNSAKDNKNKSKTDPSNTDFSLDFDDLDELDDDLSKDNNEKLAASSDLDDVEDIEFSLDLDDGDEIESEDISLDLDSELEDDSLDDMEFDLDLDLNDDLDASLTANEKSNVSVKENKHSFGELDEDDDFSIELDDLDDNLETSLESKDKASEKDLDDELDNDFDLELEDLDDDFSLELDDLDDNVKTSSESTETDGLDDDFDLELDDLDDNVKTSSQLTETDDLDDFDLELDDLDDNVKTSSKLSEEESGDGLNNDFSVELDGDFLDLEEDDNAGDNKKASSSLSIDADDIESAKSEIDSDDSLELDSPPPTDFDMASLDEEIDAMTSGMDDSSAGQDESAETLDIDTGEELELSGDQEDEVKPSKLNINDANEDKVISADDELDFFEESDEVSTKLDLAKAYMDMGDREGAEDILNEVMEEGNEQQKSDAKLLMESL
jgi:pilus assembly protein FimV